jgi:hypothetical protein
MTTHSTPPALPELHVTQEQLDAIAGGECTAKQVSEILGDLKSTYESLVDFTSYVIERVVG